MLPNAIRTTPPVAAETLANSPLSRGCVAAWYASSGFDHAGRRFAQNTDKANNLESATQFGKAIRFSGSQGPASYALPNKAGYVLENATGMTILMAATVQTGAARTLVSATGTLTADNSWAVSVNSSGILSFYVSNASSSNRTYATNAAITSNKRGIFGAVWRGSDDLCGLYIDGAEVAGTKSGTARTNIDPSISLPISIGAPAVATSSKLIGTVEWMLVFNRALSPAEIRTLTSNPYQVLTAEAPLWLDVVSGGGTSISPSDGSLTLTGYAPSVSQSANQTVTPTHGGLVLTGYVPTLTQAASQTISPTSCSMLLTGHTPSVAQTSNQSISAVDGHITLSGKQPSVTQSVVTSVAPGAGHLTLAGKQPAIVQTANQTVAPGTGHVLFTGYSPAITGPVVEQATNYYGKGKGLSREEVDAQWELLELRHKSAPKPIDQLQPESIAREELAPAPVADVAPLSEPAPSIEVPNGLLQMPVVVAPHVDTVSELTHRLTAPVVKKPKPIKIKPIEFAAANDEDDEAALLAILEVI